MRVEDAEPAIRRKGKAHSHFAALEAGVVNLQSRRGNARERQGLQGAELDEAGLNRSGRRIRRRSSDDRRGIRIASEPPVVVVLPRL